MKGRFGASIGSVALPKHVKPTYMSWKQGRGERGYHHGNLKEALIRAALDLIAQKGPAGFTFAEAARWAGVSAAAPYRHFRDRDDLIAGVALKGFELFAAALEHAWAAGRPDPAAAFQRLGAAYLNFARREPAYYSAMFEAGHFARRQSGAARGGRQGVRHSARRDRRDYRDNAGAERGRRA